MLMLFMLAIVVFGVRFVIVGTAGVMVKVVLVLPAELVIVTVSVPLVAI